MQPDRQSDMQPEAQVWHCIACSDLCGIKRGFFSCLQQLGWHRDKGIQKEVMELKVKCSNAVHSCKWQGKVKDLEVYSHMYYTHTMILSYGKVRVKMPSIYIQCLIVGAIITPA